MKLNNLTIVPKLAILVGVTLVGLCVAGGLAAYLMQQEMLRARIDQTKSIERAVGSLKLNAIAFEGSDSLDAPDKVFK